MIGAVSSVQRSAPWPDFKGSPIFEGDKIRHPDGTEGTVVFLSVVEEEAAGYGWKVDYGEIGTDGKKVLWWLGLQIGDKGMAVVIHD